MSPTGLGVGVHGVHPGRVTPEAAAVVKGQVDGVDHAVFFTGDELNDEAFGNGEAGKLFFGGIGAGASGLGLLANLARLLGFLGFEVGEDNVVAADIAPTGGDCVDELDLGHFALVLAQIEAPLAHAIVVVAGDGGDDVAIVDDDVDTGTVLVATAADQQSDVVMGDFERGRGERAGFSVALVNGARGAGMTIDAETAFGE